MSIDPKKRWLSIKGVGVKGLNTFDDSTNIDPQELSDAQNVTARDGFLTPREGTTLLYTKPSGESAAPLQLITAKTSDGLSYLIAIYGNKFYLRHETNDEWIQINQTYVPTELATRYSDVSWNGGRGDDRLYVGNGVDSNMLWDMCVTTATVASSGASTITLADGTRFPASGTLIIQGDAGIFLEAYTSRSGSVFSLFGTLSDDVTAGASVVSDMIEKDSMTKGRFMQKHDGRLHVANGYGSEVVISGSVKFDPESFVVGTSIASAFTQDIPDGNGGITGMHDFGTFLVVEKEDSLHSVKITVDDNITDKVINVTPIISGNSLGPIDSKSTVNMRGSLYYPTSDNGFMRTTPANTGSVVSIQPEPISMKIDNYIKKQISLSSCVGEAADNKVVWAIGLKGSTKNTVVVELDLLRGTWFKHTGLAVEDLTVKDNEFLYLDNGTGNIIKLFDGTYNDKNNGFLSSATMARLDFGEPAVPKEASFLYVQGFMNSITELYVDVFFNEDSTSGLEKQTYLLNKNTEGLNFSDPITGSMGQFILGKPVLGGSVFSGVPNLISFRGYLAIPSNYQWYTLQPRFYCNTKSFWAVSVAAVDAQVENVTPQTMMISPITN